MDGNAGQVPRRKLPSKQRMVRDQALLLEGERMNARREERRERKRERRMAFVNGMEGEEEGQFSEASFTAAADRTVREKLVVVRGDGRKRVLGPKRDAERHGGEKRRGRDALFEEVGGAPSSLEYEGGKEE